jgi:hypothetical protein
MDRKTWTLFGGGIVSLPCIRPRAVVWLKGAHCEHAGVLDLCRASVDEQRRPLPGDDLVSRPRWVITHAITINAPPRAVWPWVIQMGAGRAGWYAYDHIDNAGVPSARRVVPELQQVAVGDVLPALPGSRDAFIVGDVMPERALVLVAPLEPDAESTAAGQSVADPRVSWAIVLEPLEDSRTRLISRGRISPDWLASQGVNPASAGKPLVIERVYGLMARMPLWLLKPVAGSGHYLMESRMLRGIKQRAEQRWTMRGAGSDSSPPETLHGTASH